MKRRLDEVQFSTLLALASTLAASAAQAQPSGPPPCTPNFVITREVGSLDSCTRTLPASGGAWLGRPLERRADDVYCQYRWTPHAPAGAPSPPPSPPPPAPPPGPGLPLLRIDPGTADFGSVTVGQSSGITFSVTNVGAPLAVGPLAPSLVGPDASQFAVTRSSCLAFLPPGQACAVTVAFRPTTPRRALATLVVALPPVSVAGSAALQGTGRGPLLAAHPTAVSFHPVIPHGSGDPVQITIGNGGNAPSGPLGVGLEGADRADFAILKNDCSTLSPGQLCNVSVQFRPRDPSGKQANLVVVAGSSVARVGLRGSGWNAPPATARPDLTPFESKVWGYDCPMVASAKPVVDLSAQLEQAFEALTGRVPLPGPPLNRVRVAVVDSAVHPYGSTDSDTFRHGHVVDAIIAELSGLPATDIHNYLALPLVNALAPEENWQDGGYFGTTGHLVAAVHAALDDWPLTSPERMVINLSLGWEPAQADPVANAAVLAVLQRAACRGALVLAAAGNRNGTAAGPLYPARWEAVEPQVSMTTSRCLSQGYPVPASSTVAPGRPIVYGVGALDASSAPLPVTRLDSLPARVAYGVSFPVPAPGSMIATDGVMSGTSMATAALSGIAAATWGQNPPGTPGFALVKQLETSGDPTGLAAPASGNGAQARRVRLCRALTGVPGAVPCPDDNVTLITPGPPDPTQPSFNGTTCVPGADSCVPDKPVEAWVLPMPGWPGCKDCRYDRFGDTLTAVMTDDMAGFGPTVLRFVGGGYAVDVRYADPTIKLPPAFWATMGLSSVAPTSATVQFGTYFANTFIASTSEESVIITN
jgi:hypothetical protein